MPTLEENISKWDKDYVWTEQGDEWSESWGNSDSLWNWIILPRIKKFLPCENILEIAPGYGRFTEYLKNYCENLFIVDISETCIEHCKKRFSDNNNIHYFVNDGKSLDMVQDKSIDFVFSFDSLVHAESDVITSYIEQISRKFTKDGAGFIHHSNRNAYNHFNNFTYQLFPVYITRKSHWRAKSVSGNLFESLCAKNGCNCISQKYINWGGHLLIDCLTSFTINGSKYQSSNTTLENFDFMKHAGIVKNLSKLY